MGGRAIEPVVREAMRRSPERLPEGTRAIGGYWTRSNDPEIDLVGADRAPVAKKITCVGSIKWLENRPFGGPDLNRLILHRSKLPGADESTPLLAISRSGVEKGVGGVSAFSPDDLITAWQPGPGAPRPPEP